MFFFFRLAHLIHYTDMKLYILQYKRKMGREKHSFAQRSWVRERVVGHLFFFPFFYFLAGWGPGLEDDKREQKQFTKSQSAKGCIFLQI